jgi:hypothetical protein
MTVTSLLRVEVRMLVCNDPYVGLLLLGEALPAAIPEP